MNTTSEARGESAGGIAGFCRRQFAGNGSTPQLVFDVSFGIVLPVLCLVFDPIVFLPGGFLSIVFLQDIRLFAYLSSFLGICALAYYLWTRKGSIVLAGMLFGSMAFSLAIGIALAPLSAVGLLIFIGIFGFTPFVTAFVFLRNAHRCRRDAWAVARKGATRGPAALRFVLGVTLILGVPGVMQATSTAIARRAMTSVIFGSEQELPNAVRILKRVRIAADTDQIVHAFQKTGDEGERARLSWAYQEITGKNIQVRIAELGD
jgi:hypothetical protein